jgi:hypothetical protein
VGKHGKLSSTNVPETISDAQWHRITCAAAQQTPSPLDPSGSGKQDTWTASARNAGNN